MATWDVFHSDRLEVERGLTTAEVRESLKNGDLRNDDLVRPAGTTIPWVRTVDLPDLKEPEPSQSQGQGQSQSQSQTQGASSILEEAEDEVEPPFPMDAEFAHDPESTFSLGSTHIPPSTTEDIGADPLGPDAIEDLGLQALIDDDDDEDGDDLRRLGPGRDSTAHSPYGPNSSIEALPAEPDEILEAQIDDDEEDEDDAPLAEDEAAAEFTLTRGGPETVEELDLAAMVDVAFQLVLFFLVTASTLVFKTLEVPAPKPEDAAAAVSQGSKTPEDLMDTYILVEVDPSGVLKVDHEPAPSDMRGLSDRLRAARASTGRLKMLLMADAATAHRNAVLAYDAANEVGLGIAIARPTGGTPK